MLRGRARTMLRSSVRDWTAEESDQPLEVGETTTIGATPVQVRIECGLYRALSVCSRRATPAVLLN